MGSGQGGNGQRAAGRDGKRSGDEVRERRRNGNERKGVD